MRLFRRSPPFLFWLTVGLALPVIIISFPLFELSNTLSVLADRSAVTVARATQTARDARLLDERVHALERSIRQYFVLHDSVIADVANTNHAEIVQLLNGLEKNNGTDILKTQLETIREEELSVYQAFQEKIQRDTEPKKPITKKIDINAQTDQLPQTWENQFTTISQESENLIKNAEKLIDKEVQQLRKYAANQNTEQLKLAVIAAPTALLLLFLIGILLAKSIKQLRLAIRRLGEHSLEQKIDIRGPVDIARLGDRLDELRMRLLSLEQDRRRFVRHISHELKTPLAAIKEGASLLNDGIVGSISDEQHQVVDIIGENCTRLKGLIDRLLEFQRQASAAFVLKPTLTDFVVLLQEVVARHQLPAQARQLTFKWHMPNSLHVRVDGDKIQTVVDNLISNAVKFSPDGGIIYLVLTVNVDNFELEVIDQGVGISVDEQEEVFDVFYRSKSSSQYEGSGVGLAVAKEFTVAHGGSLVAANHKEYGACFSLKLPL